MCLTQSYGINDVKHTGGLVVPEFLWIVALFAGFAVSICYGHTHREVMSAVPYISGFIFSNGLHFFAVNFIKIYTSSFDSTGQHSTGLHSTVLQSTPWPSIYLESNFLFQMNSFYLPQCFIWPRKIKRKFTALISVFT